MTRKIPLTLCLLFLILLCSFSQVTIKGVATKGFLRYNPGDTVRLYGMKVSNSDTFFFVKEQNFYAPIPDKKINSSFKDLNFWEARWFEHQGIEIHKNGWKLSERAKLDKMAVSYIANFKNNNLMYEDLYVESYLLDVLKKIHPGKLHKGRNLYFTVKILNHEDEILYCLENATILISTQTITNLKSEKELFQKLSMAVAHIVLDHNMACRNVFYEDTRYNLGIVYTTEYLQTVKRVSFDFLKYYEDRNNGSAFIDDKEFLEKISSIVSYTAWQEYYSQQYPASLNLVNKLIEYDLAIDEDYLLKAKNLRITGSDMNSITEAVACLETADSLSNHKLIDVFPEKGVIYIRAGMWQEAMSAFETYREMLKLLAGMEAETRWCNQMIQKCQRNLAVN
ncbi:MAG: hypothetical protein JXB00_18415 [Bacteroidales bacterium]|nr:hypothetical protein [Bacteroidales bacterium]